MVELNEVARVARLRARQKMEGVSDHDKKDTKAFLALNQPFHLRLLEACKKAGDTPDHMNTAMFVALPERLLAKIAYLCLDKNKRLGDGQSSLTQHMVDSLISYTGEERDAQFLNFDTGQKTEGLKNVLLCHGLSPIGDSILLLADVGRGFRASAALGLGMQVMVADISWMSSNRSIRQFESLSMTDIDTGLRVCLDKRKRLYEALSITPRDHKIVPFNRPGTISARKLEQISSRYLALARAIWGDDVEGRLEIEKISNIDRPLHQLSLRKEAVTPAHMAAFSQFPDALKALEGALEPHLGILRVIAKQFHTFDTEVFTYFFAQYYAQDNYRGSALKVAPISEKRFDEPFDKLDAYFRAWGEGHSTSDILAAALQNKAKVPLAVAYLPQYVLNGIRVLPYTPLSLDALKAEKKDHRVLQQKLIMVEGDGDREHVGRAIEGTPVYHRNRLIADLLSFFMLARRRVSDDEVEAVCRELGTPKFTDVLRSIDQELPEIFVREADAETAEDLRGLWQSWMENIEADANPSYIPTQVYCSLFDVGDWTAQRIEAASALVRLAQGLHRRLTT